MANEVLTTLPRVTTLQDILDACVTAVELEGTPGECPRFELFYLVRGIANALKGEAKQ
jgi:hypothetical protein